MCQIMEGKKDLVEMWGQISDSEEVHLPSAWKKETPIGYVPGCLAKKEKKKHTMG